ncbi:helix-turn-helix domain-containing protein [Tateyamaria sp. SN3-11]|uniref:helix-turn-helix domain-containing protein n=1 Tax=Tateyamaria sp. SN3-11 TaxID=3092147 RepID=UPI0039EC3FCD
MTLAALADKSGISRATLSRIENSEVSPTAETLGRLAAVYAVPISRLLAPMEQVFQPVIPRADQAIWRDPEHGFERRSVSPSNGPLAVELIEGTIEPNQEITYTAPAIPGQEHHVYVLSGQIEIAVEGRPNALHKGDCLRYVLFGETRFRTGDAPCTYVIALK